MVGRRNVVGQHANVSERNTEFAEKLLQTGLGLVDVLSRPNHREHSDLAVTEQRSRAQNVSNQHAQTARVIDPPNVDAAALETAQGQRGSSRSIELIHGSSDGSRQFVTDASFQKLAHFSLVSVQVLRVAAAVRRSIRHRTGSGGQCRRDSLGRRGRGLDANGRVANRPL
jgi:hypothetical protein